MRSDYIKETYSKKHHYLPVFYLKGFADKEGLIYVYDKVKDTILLRQKPESKFYEKHLNNYKLGGEVKFTLEEPVFTPMDTEGSKLFVKIRGMGFTSEEQITALEKFEMLGFITRLYWRLPESNKLFVDLIKKEGLSNRYFGFFKNGEPLSVPDEEIAAIKTQILNDEEIQKVFKHVIPLSRGTEEEVERLYDKWRLYTLQVKRPNIITGDSPFLINNNDIRLDNIFDELIFPIGKNKLLTLSDKSPQFLDVNLLITVNLSILHQSKRFIASDNVEQLKQILVDYNKLVQKNLDKNLVKDTFNIMYNQSTFKDYNEYCEAYKNAKF